MTRNRVGRPNNKVLKSSIYLSLTFDQLQVLERVAWFLSIQRGKHCTRNDALIHVIETQVREKVKHAEKLFESFKKQQAASGESVTNKGFREWLIKQKEVEDDTTTGPVAGQGPDSID